MSHGSEVISCSAEGRLWLTTLAVPSEDREVELDLGDLVVDDLGSNRPSVTFSVFAVPRMRELIRFVRSNVVDVVYRSSPGDHRVRDDDTLTVHACRLQNVEFAESAEGNRYRLHLAGTATSGTLVPWLP